MLGRALSLATVMFLIGCLGPALAPAQAQNLEAGKSPSQIFAGTCAACHKSPRGLLRSVPAGSLPGFLREHYTTSSGMASLLSNYLISNGANDARYGAGQPRSERGMARSGGQPEQVDRRGRRISPPREVSEPPQSARPDANRLAGQAEPRRRGRNAKRQDRVGPEGATPAEVQAPGEQANQHGRDGRKARHRPARRGKPALDQEPGVGAASPATGNSEAAKPDNAKPGDTKPEADKADTGGEPKSGPAPVDAPTTAAKPSSEGGSDAAKVEAPKEAGSAAAAPRSEAVSPAASPSAASTAAPGGGSAASSAAPEHPPTASGPAQAAPEGPTAAPADK
jgi:hypothetical protein